MNSILILMLPPSRTYHVSTRWGKGPREFMYMLKADTNKTWIVLYFLFCFIFFLDCPLLMPAFDSGTGPMTKSLVCWTQGVFLKQLIQTWGAALMSCSVVLGLSAFSH